MRKAGVSKVMLEIETAQVRAAFSHVPLWHALIDDGGVVSDRVQACCRGAALGQVLPLPPNSSALHLPRSCQRAFCAFWDAPSFSPMFALQVLRHILEGPGVMPPSLSLIPRAIKGSLPLAALDVMRPSSSNAWDFRQSMVVSVFDLAFLVGLADARPVALNVD